MNRIMVLIPQKCSHCSHRVPTYSGNAFILANQGLERMFPPFPPKNNPISDANLNGNNCHSELASIYDNFSSVGTVGTRPAKPCAARVFRVPTVFPLFPRKILPNPSIPCPATACGIPLPPFPVGTPKSPRRLPPPFPCRPQAFRDPPRRRPSPPGTTPRRRSASP